MPKLFEEFERIEENKNRYIEGTGLGMNITTQLLYLMGSRLEVESTYGKGSRFFFDLEQNIVDDTPLGDFEARMNQAAEMIYAYAATLYAPNAHILVVDDNPVNRRVLISLLKPTGIHVMEAGSGARCLDLIKQNHFDLIFLDHMMPGMDGMETLRRMKQLKEQQCSDTPVIALTANAVSGAKESYLAAGFDGFLAKPIISDKLENLIREFLPSELILKKEDAKLSVEQELSKTTNSEFLESLPTVEGLDWNYAWMHLPGQEILTYTVQQFHEMIRPESARLEDLYEHIGKSGNLELFRIRVHGTKSAAALIGMVPLAGVAKLLENAAAHQEMDVIKMLTPIFLKEWRSFEDRLIGVLGIEEVKRTEITDFSVVKALLEMVRISMQEMDIDAADEAVHQLKNFIYPQEMEAEMEALGVAVANLDGVEVERITVLLAGKIDAYKGGSL